MDARVPPVGSDEHPLTVRGIDRVMSVQRPLVVAHIRSIRLRNPRATPDEIVRMLEIRYLAAVTTGGAAVGATAVVPGIGTGVTLALSGVETIGFMESTALFAQSVAEVHGIAIENPDRARALVMTLMLGKEGVDLVSQLAQQATGRGGTRSSYWGELVTKSLPRAAVGPLVDRLKSAFIRQFAGRGGRRSSARRCRSASARSSAVPVTTSSEDGCWSRRVAPSARRPSSCHPSWSRRPAASDWSDGCCRARVPSAVALSGSRAAWAGASVPPVAEWVRRGAGSVRRAARSERSCADGGKDSPPGRMLPIRMLLIRRPQKGLEHDFCTADVMRRSEAL